MVENDIDYDHEVQEALHLQRDLEAYHREMARRQTTLYDIIEERPSSVAAANSNLPGRTTPCPIPNAAVPTKSLEPVRLWDGHAAKRGVGYRSKAKKEADKRKADDNTLVPERIRQQMKRYFT